MPDKKGRVFPGIRAFLLYGKKLCCVLCFSCLLNTASCKALCLKEISVFTEGDMAVYPAHGVGVIKAVETKTIGGIDQSFYVHP